MIDEQDIGAALNRPRSDSPRIYERWLNATPTDAAYLDAAHLALDDLELSYREWRRRHGQTGRSDDAERNARAVRMASSWQDERWTNQRMQEYLRMPTERRREMASTFGVGANRRRAAGISTQEAHWFYHTVNPITLGGAAWIIVETTKWLICLF